MRLTFATGNPGKLREARTKLEPVGIELNQWDAGYPELQADTLEEVARFGARALVDNLAPPFFLEDAGLFVDALGGFPGVYSSYAFGTLGWEGILALLEEEQEPRDRSARFRSVIAYHDGSEIHLFEGVVEGAIADQGRGGQGFGYDPIFLPEGHKRTFGEMSVGEKGELSHRARALEALAEHLASDGT